MNASVTPSLFGSTVSTPRASHTPQARSLLDLMYDGFYMLLLIKNRQAPADAELFAAQIQTFLDGVERQARKLGISNEDIFTAKYAFCAMVDESVLSSQFRIRDAWERRPLQLALFGDQLAGENFFTKLEELRLKGAAHVQALEVFYVCLLMGFQGKYLLEGPEKLAYLTARLGDEIAHLKGSRSTFAPNWEPPDRIKHALKRDVPIWVVASIFALIGLSGFLGLRWHLANTTERAIAAYEKLVTLPPRTANLTITLP
ncbi:MAG TPA: type IVB secretion system protein IcmH/DotU [Burkholderiaceae bacterium]|nr:type IVB secretion system protein IcmH/DotU [Burkholderiaceae bacterium]